MDDQREFGKLVAWRGFLVGIVAGMTALWGAQALFDTLDMQVAPGRSPRLVPLWPSSVVVPLEDVVRIDVIVLCFLVGVLIGSLVDGVVTECALRTYRRRQIGQLTREIASEPDPQRRTQLIALFGLKYPGHRLPDETRD